MFLKISSIFFLFNFFNVISAAPFLNKTEKWLKPLLTYSIINSPKTLSQNDTDDAFRYAFNEWSKFAPKKFEQLSSSNQSNKTADIKIIFESFNGASLGHAFSDGEIWIRDERIFKKYFPGEKIDPYKKDITFIAMVHIQSILVWNNLENMRYSISHANFNSNGTYYFLPTVFSK